MKENKNRDTKQIIFDAAAETFAQKGYHGASMKDIAQKANIRPSSIYNHYASKELLMQSLLSYYLKRMDRFYESLAKASIDTSDNKDLGKELSKLMLSYEPDEVSLMYNLTRIVHREQFTFTEAGDAIIGEGYQKYVDAHVHFLDRLSEEGLLHSKKNNKYYGELYARLSLTFALQFLHPEAEPTIENQSIIGEFLNKLIVNYDAAGK